MFSILLLGLFLGNLANCLKVLSISNATIPTNNVSIQYESLSMNREIRNSSLHVTLQFQVTDLNSQDFNMSWKYNGKAVNVNKMGNAALLYYVKTYTESNSICSIVLHLIDASALPGNYSLLVTQSNNSASNVSFVMCRPILPIFSKPKRVLQGDPLRIQCEVLAWPLPTSITWFFSPIAVGQSSNETAIEIARSKIMELNLTQLASLSNEGGTPNDTLRFTELKPENNGLYVCQADNELGKDAAVLLVDVKDRWAALFPFIAIVIEVTVLVAAILLYERHQMRAKPQSENNANVVDAISSNQQSNANDKPAVKTDEVRFRKP